VQLELFDMFLQGRDQKDFCQRHTNTGLYNTLDATCTMLGSQGSPPDMIYEGFVPDHSAPVIRGLEQTTLQLLQLHVTIECMSSERNGAKNAVPSTRPNSSGRMCFRTWGETISSTCTEVSSSSHFRFLIHSDNAGFPNCSS